MEPHAALCQGLYHVLAKPLVGSLGVLPATAWSLWTGAALALPAIPWAVAQVRTAPASATWAAVYLGLVPSAVGFIAWSAALSRSSVARATVSLYLVPVVAMVLA